MGPPMSGWLLLWLALLFVNQEVSAGEISDHPCSTTEGDLCVFPFKLVSGEKMLACTTEGSTYGNPWCATSLDDDGGFEDFGDCDMTSCSSTTTSTTSTRSSSPTVLRTTQPSRSSEFPLWTWWSPVTETVTTDGGEDEEDTEEGEKAWEGEVVISNSVTESVTGPHYSEENSRRDNREGGSGENYLGIEIGGPAESKSESKTDDDHHQTIQQKYEEMVAHNTRLIDILRSTLEMQAELFRRMIRYLFP